MLEAVEHGEGSGAEEVEFVDLISFAFVHFDFHGGEEGIDSLLINDLFSDYLIVLWLHLEGGSAVNSLRLLRGVLIVFFAA